MGTGTMDTVILLTTHTVMAITRTVTATMVRGASSTGGIGPTIGIMGGALITVNSGTTGTVTGAKAPEVRSN